MGGQPTRDGGDVGAPRHRRRSATTPPACPASPQHGGSAPDLGHAHAHGPVPAASLHTRRVVAAVLVPAALATIVALVWLWPPPVPSAPNNGADGQRALGTVAAVSERACPPPPGQAGEPTPGQAGEPAAGQPAPGRAGDTGRSGGAAARCGTAVISVTEGPGKGSPVTVDLPQGPGAADLHVKDRVVLVYFPDAVPGGRPYSVVEQQRGTPMIWMLALAAAVILVFGRWRGVSSLAGLAVSFAVLLLFVIPAILDGSPPLLVAVVGSSAIMFAALYLTHGINVHISVAVAGTLVSLVVTGVLGAAFTAALGLTGFGGEESSYLSVTQAHIDLRGLLLAGIVIGALGVLDDVTVTQAVTVAEMSGGGLTRWELYRAASRVGRAHAASAVNTIVLAYAGTSLPLLLVVAAGNEPVSELLTSEFIAQEIMRSAVGTIGLVASVPITTALAALVADLRPRPTGRRPADQRARSQPAGGQRGSWNPTMPPSTPSSVPVVDADNGLAR